MVLNTLSKYIFLNIDKNKYIYIYIELFLGILTWSYPAASKHFPCHLYCNPEKEYLVMRPMSLNIQGHISLKIKLKDWNKIIK